MSERAGAMLDGAVAEVSRLAGPSGLGTSAARIASLFGDHPSYAERPWGDGTAPPLYVPVVERVDEPLGTVVDERLVAWARECGFAEDDLEPLRKAGFGRLATLTHTDSADPEHLLIAARLDTAWWAADDLYADDSGMGAVPVELPPRGVYPSGVDHNGHQIPGWRGVPIFPCGKIPVSKTRTSSITLMRTGEDAQGVIGLRRTGLPDEYQPGLNVRFMGTDEKAITSYLVSAY